VKSKRSRIFGSSDWTRGNKDRGRQGKRSARLADSKRYQGYTEVLRIDKLLLLIHQGFHIYS